MRPAQNNAGRDRQVLLQLSQDAIRLFPQQTQQLRLHRCHPASLLNTLRLTRAQSLRTHLLCIIVADRKPRSQTRKDPSPASNAASSLQRNHPKYAFAILINVAVHQEQK